jgi:hypothetical protein
MYVSIILDNRIIIFIQVDAPLWRYLVLILLELDGSTDRVKHAETIYVADQLLRQTTFTR